MKRRGIKLSLLGSVSLLGILALSSCEVDLSNLGNIKITTDDGNTSDSSNNSGTGTNNSGSGDNTGTGTSNTGTGNTGTGNSGTDNSGTGNSGTGNSGTGNSGTGNSGTGNSGTGNSGTGNSGSGNTGTGNTGTGGTNNDNPTYTSYKTHNYVEGPAAPTYSTDGGELDVFINYSGTSGVSRAASQPTVSDPVTGDQLAPGAMLPTWKAFQSYTKTTIKDATTYSQTKDDLVWNAVAVNNKIMSQTESSRNVDLIYNATGNKGFGKDYSYLTPIEGYLNEGKMPNFKAYLDKNPDVKKMLTIDGHIYYTPYFDGQDDIERMFLMDTALTKKVLDATSGWDTTTTNGGSNPASNVVQGGFYKPFMDAENNYSEKETKVKVLFEGTAKDVTIFQTTNIIKQQNELLDKGCTGQELAQQFIEYIKVAFKDLFDNGYYENPSDLFVSDSAAFNADELIALLRVVKANPGMISGDANAEITTFFPRAASNNRIENIYDFAQIWGVQGVDGENGSFYIGGDGKVHTLQTTQASYDALEYLSQIYDEGLILKDFYTDGASGSSTGFLDKFYKKTAANPGYGFMMYDYAAANCAANDIVGGIGTKSEKRKDSFASDYECKGITAVLAPLTYWATGSEWTADDAITSRTGKTLTRYYESNRALKTNSWAIPVNSDNKEGAVRLMDFMFSGFGQLVNNYGPTEYWAKPNTLNGDKVDGTYDANKVYVSDDLTTTGELNPILSEQVKDSIATQSGDFWSYSRGYLGATHGIGNVRPAGVNLQATNAYAQAGIANVQAAFTVGGSVVGDGAVMKLATISKVKENGETKYTWNTCVPSGFTTTPSDDNGEWQSLVGFWADNKLGTNVGWVNAVTRGHNNSISDITVYSGTKGTTGTTFAKVLEEKEVFNKKCLYGYAFSITGDDTYVPSYAK